MNLNGLKTNVILFMIGELQKKKLLNIVMHMGLIGGGLYKDRKRLSCWICPLQGVNDLRLLYKNFPELWKRLIELNEKVVKNVHLENKVTYEFKQMCPKDRTLSQWEDRFKKELAEEKEEYK